MRIEALLIGNLLGIALVAITVYFYIIRIGGYNGRYSSFIIIYNNYSICYND